MFYNMDYFWKSVDFFCYHRSKMTAFKRAAYDKMRIGFLSCCSVISVGDLSFEQVQSVYQEVLLDHPYLFYIESISISYQRQNKTIIPLYRFSKEKIEKTLSELFYTCESIAQKCRISSDIEKETIIHNFLCQTVIYDDRFSVSSFECIGPLLFGKGVCEGIAKAAKILFDFVGIKSVIVHGHALSSTCTTAMDYCAHAWNIVKIDDTFYHLDITFDLTLKCFNTIRYDYFNLSDAKISADHKSITGQYPVCMRENCYYCQNHMYMRTPNEYASYLISCIQQRKRDIIFQIPQQKDFVKANKTVMDITEKCMRELHHEKEYQIMYNENLFVFHLHIL